MTVAHLAAAATVPAAPVDLLYAADLHDLAEALARTSAGWVITPAAELDRCEFCPPHTDTGQAPLDGVAVLAHQTSGSPWTYREACCPGCLPAAVTWTRATLPDVRVWVEIPAGAAA